jgi:hypothetical protein
MSTSMVDYNGAILTGIVGVVLEYYKKNNINWQSALKMGFLEKGVTSAIASYLQQMDFPILGRDLDSNYIYNLVLGALMTKAWKQGRSPLSAGTEQLLCSLIGHRLSRNFDNVYGSVSQKIYDIFPGSKGYGDRSNSTGPAGYPMSNSTAL